METVDPIGSFCWIELGTTDQDAAKAFYGKLFDWAATDVPIGPGSVHTTFRLGGRDAAAAYSLAANGEGGPPRWTIFVAVPDADDAARRARALGARVEREAFDVMGLGRMAVLRDPLGAAFRVWQPGSHRGLGVRDEPGAFCWGQLNTTDAAASEPFYRSLFGWDAKTGSDGAMTYTEWILGGRPIGGMMAMPPGAGSPHWLPYFAVASVDATAALAASLGAATCVPPTDIPGTGRFAVLADPQGAVFAVYREADRRRP